MNLKELHKLYGLRIKFANEIESYINNPIVQYYINRSVNQELTTPDYDWLIDNGSWHGKYPKLNWLCTIYIHPLTKWQNLANKVDRLTKTF